MNRVTLRSRLLIGFGLLAATVAAVAGLAIVSLDRVVSSIGTVNEVVARFRLPVATA